MADSSANTATATHQIHQNNGGSNPNKGMRISPEKHHMNFPNNQFNQNVLIRERSFIRNSNQQNMKNRRSLAIMPNNQGNMRAGKPTMEIYRPPKLNYQLHQSSSSSNIYAPHVGNHMLQQSKSSASIPVQHRHRLNAIPIINPESGLQILQGQYQRTGIVSPNGAMQMSMSMGHHPLVNSPSTGNILHQASHRVKFAPEPHIQRSQHHNFSNNNNKAMNQQPQQHVVNGNGNFVIPPLQRSKSLSSADAITKGLAGLGLGLGGDQSDIGQFPPDIQSLMDKAMDDPNQLSARNLMELVNHIMQRSIEGRRYALPTSKVCLTIIAKERKETFLEAMLNNCRQWYQEREKILYSYQGMKTPARTKFTAFMAFLTEMFCQLKRRQLQLRTQCDGAPPSLVLLTLLSKCCEDCVKPPIRSLSEIECLFFVLTCIGRDLETQLPKQLEKLLASVRDAFLNSNASAPAIRRTLLQLIELHASNWQLPGNTVLYYYPSSK